MGKKIKNAYEYRRFTPVDMIISKISHLHVLIM